MQCHHFHGIKAQLRVFLNTNSSALSYNYSVTHPDRRSAATVQAKSLNVSSFSYCDDNHLSNVGHGIVENSASSECSISDSWGNSNVANICANCCCWTCMISQNARPLISKLALEFFKVAELLQDKTITQSSSIRGSYYYIHPHKYIMQKHTITSCLYIFACYSKWGSLLQIYCAHFDVLLEFIIGGFGQARTNGFYFQHPFGKLLQSTPSCSWWDYYLGWDITCRELLCNKNMTWIFMKQWLYPT